MGAGFILQKRDRRDRIASSVHDIAKVERVRLLYAKYRGVVCRMNPVVYDIV